MIVVKPRLVVFSKGKPEGTFTYNWMDAYGYHDPIFLISPEDNLKEYQASHPNCQVMVAKDAMNLPSKRNWAVRNFTSKSQPWLLFCEDNIDKVTKLKEPLYCKSHIVPHGKPGRESEWNATRKDFGHMIGPLEAIDCMLEDIEVAMDLGAVYGGFSPNDNFYFRTVKYRYVGFVWSKLAYCSRNGPKWPEYAYEKDDYAMTAACLSYSGRVVINNYIYAWPNKEVRGASRSVIDRAPDRAACVKRLHRQYPGMYRDKNRKSRPEGTEIQLAFTSPEQVDKWRQEHPNAYEV
jgi:hypothetical protein